MLTPALTSLSLRYTGVFNPFTYDTYSDPYYTFKREHLTLPSYFSAIKLHTAVDEAI